MNTCKTCKHWTQTQEGWGDCRILGEYTSISSQAWLDEWAEPGSSDADFGCIKWEEKEKDEQ